MSNQTTDSMGVASVSRKAKIITYAVATVLAFALLCALVSAAVPTFEEHLKSELSQIQRDWKDWDYQQQLADKESQDARNKKVELESRAENVRALLGDFKKSAKTKN